MALPSYLYGCWHRRTVMCSKFNDRYSSCTISGDWANGFHAIGGWFSYHNVRRFAVRWPCVS